MRDKEETFILTPREIFQQDIIDTRMDFLVQKINSLEEKVNKISEALTEILKRLEPSENVLEVRSQRRYGFTPEDEVD